MKKYIGFLNLLLFPFFVFAQGEVAPAQQSFFLSNLKIYVVVAVLVIILAVIALYLFSVEKRLKELENKQ